MYARSLPLRVFVTLVYVFVTVPLKLAFGR